MNFNAINLCKLDRARFCILACNSADNMNGQIFCFGESGRTLFHKVNFFYVELGVHWMIEGVECSNGYAQSPR
jgi:hypothetical protein